MSNTIVLTEEELAKLKNIANDSGILLVDIKKEKKDKKDFKKK